jgi:hypothetical protein
MGLEEGSSKEGNKKEPRSAKVISASQEKLMNIRENQMWEPYQ